jgi:hypothetical protein
MEFMDLIETPRVDNIKLSKQAFNESLSQTSTIVYDGSIILTTHHSIFTLRSPDGKGNEEIWV